MHRWMVASMDARMPRVYAWLMFTKGKLLITKTLYDASTERFAVEASYRVPVMNWLPFVNVCYAYTRGVRISWYQCATCATRIRAAYGASIHQCMHVG